MSYSVRLRLGPMSRVDPRSAKLQGPPPSAYELMRRAQATKIDLAALERSMKIAQKDRMRRAQIAAMLKNSWHTVAEFAACDVAGQGSWPSATGRPALHCRGGRTHEGGRPSALSPRRWAIAL